MSTLYISDLDGTLLTNDATLSEFSRNTLQTLLNDGLSFSVASARSVVAMQAMFDGLRLKLPVIEFNGAFLSDLDTGRHEIINAIGPEVAEDVYNVIINSGCAPFVSTFNGNEDCVYHLEAINDGMHWYINDRHEKKDSRFRSVDDLIPSLQEQVVCLTVIAEAGNLSELESAILERHEGMVEIHHFENHYSPGWYWLTVHDRRATKDQAIRALMDNYGLNDSDLIVFGDHINDIKIFQIATESVAVANATDELKQHATHIIGSNQEDSVVKYIQGHWKNSRRI